MKRDRPNLIRMSRLREGWTERPRVIRNPEI